MWLGLGHGHGFGVVRLLGFVWILRVVVSAISMALVDRDQFFDIGCLAGRVDGKKLAS
jgi:hypothetical protein